MDVAAAFNSHPIPVEAIEGAEWEDVLDLFGPAGAAMPMAPAGLDQLESLRAEIGAAAAPDPTAAAAGAGAGDAPHPATELGAEAATEAVWVTGAVGLQSDFFLPSLRPPEFDSLDSFLAHIVPPLTGDLEPQGPGGAWGAAAAPAPAAPAAAAPQPCGTDLTGQVARSEYHRVLDTDPAQGACSTYSAAALSSPAVLQRGFNQHPGPAAAAAAAAAAAGGAAGGGLAVQLPTPMTQQQQQRVSPFAATSVAGAGVGGVGAFGGFSIQDLSPGGVLGLQGGGGGGGGGYPAAAPLLEVPPGGAAGSMSAMAAAAAGPTTSSSGGNGGGGGGGAKETCRACGYRGAFGNRTRLCNDCIEHRSLMDAPRHDKQRGAVVKLALGDRMPGFYFARQRRMVPHTADTLVEEVLARWEGLDWGAADPAALLDVVVGQLLSFRVMLAQKGRTSWEAAVVTPEQRGLIWQLLRDAYRRYQEIEVAADVPVAPAAALAPTLPVMVPQQQQQQQGLVMPFQGTTPESSGMAAAAAAPPQDIPASKRAKVVTTGGVTHTPPLPVESPHSQHTALLLGAAGSGVRDVGALLDQQQQGVQQGAIEWNSNGWVAACTPEAPAALMGAVGAGGATQAQTPQSSMPPELAAALQQYSAAAAEAVRHRKRVRALLEEQPQLQMAVAQMDVKVWGVEAGSVPRLVGPAAGALSLAAQGGEAYMEPGCVRVTLHLLMSRRESHQLAAAGMASFLDTLLVHTPPTSPWRTTSWSLQLGDTLAVAKAGRPAALLDVSPEAAEAAGLPVVHRVGLAVLVGGGTGTGGVEFTVEGCHLGHPGVKFAVKSENRKLWEASGLPVAAEEQWEDDVDGSHQVDQTVKFTVTPPSDLVLPALVWVEATQGLYAAPAVPVLLVQDPQVVQELNQLEGLGLAPAYTAGLLVNAALVLQAAAGRPHSAMGAKATAQDLADKAAGLAALAGVMGWAGVAAAVAPLLAAAPAAAAGGGGQVPRVAAVAKAAQVPGLPQADSRASAVSVTGPDDASTTDASSEGDAAGGLTDEEEEEGGELWGAAAPDVVAQELPVRRPRSLTYQDSAVDRHAVNAFRSKLTMVDEPLSSVSEREAAQPVLPGARSSGSCNF